MPELETTAPMTDEPQGSVAGPRFLVARLSALILIAFAIMGAWVPVFTLHLKQLGFSPEATAWASAGNAIAAMLAPLLWGQVADRWLAMQRCISLCALATGIGLLTLAELCDPFTVILASLAMWYFLIPTIGLSTSLIFRQLDHPEREYGKIRMWGTVGWVAASWCLTLWFNVSEWLTGSAAARDLADSLRLGGLAALLLAAYAWTPARAWYARWADAPLTAMYLFRDRSFAVYSVCMFGLNVTLAFSIQLNPLLFAGLGVSAEQLPLCLTIAQSTEVLFLYLLPLLLLRFGTKPIMVLGGFSWTVGMASLAIGAPLWLTLGSLVTHGVFICCFFIAGQVFVNRQASHDIRASAQGLLLLISGSGLLLGHLLVGWIRAETDDNYRVAYVIAAGVTAALMGLFVACFAASPPISGQESLVPESEMT
jgi:MFS family permease